MRRLLLGMMIGLALVGVGRTVDWTRISVDGLQGSLNDQVGYISVARHMADGQGMVSSIIYPSVLRQRVSKNTLYMPGFYWALAFTYRLLGYSVAASFVPSLASYLLACWLTYWIAGRLYGESAASYGGALFAFFPLCLVFAFTAMAEMPVVAAGLTGLAVFLWGMGGERLMTGNPTLRKEGEGWGTRKSLEIPPFAKSAKDGAPGAGKVDDLGEAPWKAVVVGALVLVVPLVFRETGVVVGVVMLAVLIAAARERWWRVGAGAAALMTVVVGAVMLSPAGAGRPSLWRADVLTGGDPRVVYADAYAMERLPSGLRDWAGALRGNLRDNARNLWRARDADGWAEKSAVWFLLSGIPLGAWLWWRRRDAFAGGVSAAVAALLAADLSCYDIWGYHGVRALLVMQPLVAILWGAVVARWLGERGWWRGLALAACFVAGMAGAVVILGAQAEVNADTLEDVAFLEAIRPDNRLLVASPYEISLGYVQEHYPVRWAFLPSDCRTMRLLDERYEIGTVILPEDASAEMLGGCGLPFSSEEEEHAGVRYRVLSRKSTEYPVPSTEKRQKL
jgi:hypothetical protein